MDFSQIQLIYSAEGNANLVVALPQLKKVLRLPKANSSSTRSSKCDDRHRLERQKRPPTACDGTNPNGVVTTLDMDQTLGGCCCTVDDVEDDAVCPEDLVAFVSAVARFIGKEYVNIPEIVNITSEADRRRINNFCRPFRPAHRLDKEFCGQFGLLLPDATLLPETLLFADLQHQLTPGDTFAVDIKPKQGWLLQDIDVEVGGGGAGVASSANSFLNPFNLKASTRCRYCAMQFSKLRSRKVSRLSAYCPIDMFSGKPLEMRKSLNALLECPQNNLRIFRNGQLIYGDQAGLITLEELKMNTFHGDLTTFQDLIISCLRKNYSMETGGNGGGQGNNVLERILNIQLLAKKYITEACYQKSNTNTTKRKTYIWLKQFLARGPNTKLQELTDFEQYLLAATFLDCSIIVAFKEIILPNKLNSNHPNVVQLNGKAYVTKVTVLDLDPKPDNHFQKFVKNTNQAYSCAEEEKQ